MSSNKMRFHYIILIAILASSIPLVSAMVAKISLDSSDIEFLEDLEHRAFLYFWENSGEKTGLTLDRTHTNGETYPNTTNNHNVASIAATGFALTSYCIAAELNWKSAADLRERTKITLNFFANRAFHKEGWFYHWLDSETGERRWNSEISSIDTTLLLGGVFTVRQCFGDDYQIVRLATIIYERVNFQWMLNGHEHWLSHGWKPEMGFLKNYWNDYSEQTMLNLLAIASPTFPVSWRSWYALKRDYRDYQGYQYMAAVPPLFIHQYSHAFFDFRGKRERFQNYSVNYFENSVFATRAQREFFIEVLSKKWPKYNENIWGLTASDTANGYRAWGAPPEDPDTDGSVVPCAAAGSLMFTPDIALSALKQMKSQYPATYGRYGFTDAFNPENGWINADVLGIDVGITLLSAENLRSGKVWKWFMGNLEASAALEAVHLLNDDYVPQQPRNTASKIASMWSFHFILAGITLLVSLVSR